MKAAELDALRRMTTEELNSELREAERALLHFRFDAGLNRLTNPSGMHATRKKIAVVKTILRENELLASTGFASMDEYKAFKVTERRTYRQSKVAR